MSSINIHIGEECPYLFPLENLRIEKDLLIITVESTLAYQNSNFSKLLQVISSIGSCSLSHSLQLDNKHYFLGEKLRIRKCNYDIREGSLILKSNSIIHSKRKGKSFVNVFDERDSLAYTFELDYTVFSEESFNKLFKDHFIENCDSVFNETYPEIQNEMIGVDFFITKIDAFILGHCQGHFKNHPIVPAVFIVNRLIESISIFINDLHHKYFKTIEVDCLEIFPIKAMPINIPLISENSIFPISARVYLFVCELKDLDNNKYGIYSITIQI